MKNKKADKNLCDAWATTAFAHGDTLTGAIALFASGRDRRKEVPKGLRRAQAMRLVQDWEDAALAARD
jgi:hypothetical protein